jgi:hypothetical protein
MAVSQFRNAETGEMVERIPCGFGERDLGFGQCGDCGVEDGQYHHRGCDQEECPVCGSQAISCGCISEEDVGSFTDDTHDMPDDSDWTPDKVEASEDLEEEGWHLVGHCAVDCGQLMLVDPGYVLPEEDKSDDKALDVRRKAMAQIKADGDSVVHDIDDGLCVMFLSGEGDGYYPVYAKFTGHGRVAEVKVVCLTPQQVGEYDDYYTEQEAKAESK